MKPTYIQRILIVKLSAIGDVAMATPVPKALKERLPSSYIAWLVEDKAQEVVQGHPYLDEVIVVPRRRWAQLQKEGAWVKYLREVWAFIRQIRVRKFDLAIDLQGLFRSGLWTWLSGAPFRLGYSDAREGSRLFLTHVVQPSGHYVRSSERNLEVLSALGIRPASYELILWVAPEDVAYAEELLLNSGIMPGEDFVALCPATTRPNKHWTEEGFSEVIDRLAQEYGMKSVLLGSGADLPLLRRIAEGCAFPPVILAGRTTLKQAAAVIRKAKLLIGVDTGLLRFGLAMHTPSIALFGSTDPRHLREERVTILQKRLPCTPCRRRPICQDRDCLRAITPDEVMQAVDAWLSNSIPWAGR